MPQVLPGCEVCSGGEGHREDWSDTSGMYVEPSCREVCVCGVCACCVCAMLCLWWCVVYVCAHVVCAHAVRVWCVCMWCVCVT